MNQGPIIIVEDDKDDQDLFREAWDELNYSNEVRIFSKAKEAFDFMETEHVHPFVIISDINLSGWSGLHFKKKLNSNESLKIRSIPFVFLTTTKNTDTIIEAYELQAHGFFTKRTSVNETKRLMIKIFEYWIESVVPRD